MTRDQFKSLMLVTLFGICVVLVSQIWSGLGAGALQAERSTVNELYPKERIWEVFSPKVIVVNMGGDSHTTLYSDRYKIWSAVQSGLLRFLSGKTQERELTPAEWVDKNRYRSFRLDFPARIGMMDFFRMQGGDPLRYSGRDRSFTSLLVSLDEPDTLYFYDLSQNKCFSISGSKYSVDLGPVLAVVENAGEPDYEMVGELYALYDHNSGGQALNMTMVPRINIPSIPVYRAVSELHEQNVEEKRRRIREIADEAFGNQFDFINRLSDVSGATVFMYGYGEKAFRVHPSGLMEYQAKIRNVDVDEKKGFLETFQVASAFANKVGDYPLQLILTDYTENAETGTRHFEFSYVQNNYPVVDTVLVSGEAVHRGFEPITVDMKGLQIVGFRRLVAEAKESVDISEGWSEPMSLDDIIIQKYDVILKRYMEATGDNAPFDSGIRFRLLNSINTVRIVYCLNSSRDRLVPAWEIAFGKSRFFFNIYTGEILAAGN